MQGMKFLAGILLYQTQKVFFPLVKFTDWFIKPYCINVYPSQVGITQSIILGHRLMQVNTYIPDLS